MDNKKSYTPSEALKKAEHYCVYQDRCHQEVRNKLLEWCVYGDDLENIINHLISENFLNEERFAQSFVRGKHNYKFWGKNRIVNELKFRNISSRNIQTALKEIPAATYLHNFHALAEKNWEAIAAPKGPKKNKKFDIIVPHKIISQKKANNINVVKMISNQKNKVLYILSKWGDLQRAFEKNHIGWSEDEENLIKKL